MHRFGDGCGEIMYSFEELRFPFEEEQFGRQAAERTSEPSKHIYMSGSKDMDINRDRCSQKKVVSTQL